MLVIIILINLIANVVYWQYFSKVAVHSKNSSALTIILQMIAGIFVLIFIPFDEIKISISWKIWIMFIVASVFYGINNRIITSIFKKLPTVEVSILKQLHLVFLIAIGLIVFREPFSIKKVIGAAIILICNFMLLYEKNNEKKQKNIKYIILGVIANISMAIALSIDIDISKHFNLAIYTALSLIIPALLINLTQIKKITVLELKNEICNGKKELLIAATALGIQLYTMLKAYQLGEILTIAPMLTLSILVNVIYELLILKKKDRIAIKFFASILIFVAIILINS